MSYISYLESKLREFQDRAGPPTLDDLRACGVAKPQIFAYLRATGWECESDDRGDCQRAAWSNGPPAWHHPEHGEVDLQYQEITIDALARREGRSPWAVLDDCAAYGEPIDLYHDGELVAVKHGACTEMAAPELPPGYELDSSEGYCVRYGGYIIEDIDSAAGGMNQFELRTEALDAAWDHWRFWGDPAWVGFIDGLLYD